MGRAANVVAIPVEGRGLDATIEALERAQKISLPYVVVGGDPLQDVAVQWRALWDVGVSGDDFEVAAGTAVAAWRAKRFELPDYYLVLGREEKEGPRPHKDDFHLGYLKSKRPGRVAAVPGAGDRDEDAARLVSALPALPQGPWWPPLDRIIDGARAFYPGTLAAG